jgi:xanthine dehydrogenase YagS FAD-binding subunit
MKAFDYASPATVEEAVALLGAESAAGLSGGTDLLNRMKDGVSRPKRVVYLKGVKPLGGIAPEGEGLSIGAGTKLAEVVASDAVAKQYPALRQATAEVGTPQIRNMATVGGNLLQRPRCWYYRHGFGLLGGKKEGKSLVRELEGEYAPIDVNAEGEGKGHLVRVGDNRYGAIFMTDQDALFVNPSSLAVPLIALGATATIVGPKGERTVPVAELYRVPKAEGESELAVAPGELLTKVTIPPCKGKNASYEVRQKQSHDWPIVLCSVDLEMDGDKVTKATVVLGAVAPVPHVCEPAAQALVGKAITPETAEAAGAAAIADAKPLSMNAYKVALTKVCVKRALLAAAGQRYWEA